MSDLNFSTNLHRWLDVQNIKVPTEWVEACLEWIQEENQIQGQTNASNLQKLVYEQWLLTDLCELAVRCLPLEITAEKYTLTDTYCLQVNSVTDISQPLYSQLLKVENRDNPNSRVTAETQVTQKPWEAKPTRMLVLKLTDGAIEVSGMEYRNIPCLNENLSPGCKLRIKGPVKCRSGVLMLAASNVQFLGGEVEELVPTNNKEAVLRRKLNRPITSRTSNHAVPQVANNNNANIDLLPADLVSQLTEDDFSPLPDSGYVTGTTSLSTLNASHATSMAAESQADTVQDLEELSDLEMLHEIERVESQQMADSSGARQSPSIRTSAKKSQPSNTSNFHTWEDDDDDFILPPSTAMDLTGDGSNATSIRSCSHNPTDKQISIENELTQNLETSARPLRPSKRACGEGRNDDVIESVFMPSSLDRCGVNKTSSSQNSGLMSQVKSELSHSFSNPLLVQSDHKNSVEHPNISLKSSAMASDNSECPSLVTRLNTKANGRRGTGNQALASVVKEEECINRPVQRDAILSTSESASTLSSNNDFSRHEPTYICEAKAMKEKKMISSYVIVVKACIITLLSKLQCEPSSGWSLKARICDGTAVLDVQFSNHVLTNLIGFTSQQANEIKASCQASKLALLRDGMRKCRDVIIDMCQLMRIEHDSTASMPCVQELSDADQTYWSGIMSRTC